MLLVFLFLQDFVDLDPLLVHPKAVVWDFLPARLPKLPLNAALYLMRAENHSYYFPVLVFQEAPIQPLS